MVRQLPIFLCLPVIIENNVSKPMFLGSGNFVGTKFNNDKITFLKMTANMAATAHFIDISSYNEVTLKNKISKPMF